MPVNLASLPVGSVVNHRNSAHSCTYRKHEDGGWQVASPSAPWSVMYDDKHRVDLGTGENCTLILRGDGPPLGGKKTQRIAELETELAALQTKLEAEQATTERLRGVLRSAHGTLGAYKL